MYSTVSGIFHFSYFDPDYPTSELTVTGLAEVLLSMALQTFGPWPLSQFNNPIHSQ
jgi:hypothetical protein